MSIEPAALAPVFELTVLVGPILLAVAVARAVRGRDYDLFNDLA